jgi:hypothetical protein
MPTTFKKTGHIHSLADLKIEKKRLASQVEQSTEKLEVMITSIPGQILGSTLGMVASAVVQGLQNHWQKREDKKTEDNQNCEEEKEPLNFAQTLQSVGEETAYFALAKLVEKLISR